jgi:hypothetical protein
VKTVSANLFTSASSTDLSSGTASTWAYRSARVPYVYTIELPPLKDAGDNGFTLPASQIIPVGRETLAGIKAAAMTIKRRIGRR